MNAYERHKQFVNNYILFYGNAEAHLADTSKHKTDHDVLRENYTFLPEDTSDTDQSWEKRMVKKYHDKLFKEYALADMSRYKEGKIGLRWRTEKEVFVGKGHFTCGNKKCSSKENLTSYELNFAYKENGEHKNALVKVRVCPECAEMLNYKKNQQILKEEKKAQKREKKRQKSDITSRDERSPIDLNVSDDVESQETANAETPTPTIEPKIPSTTKDTWRENPEMEKSKDEEFDDYFEGMFM
eukprot:TRINITY_DN8328_c0_g1_i1.p1 TRINITY_DN8328_c0_g1~~TRINITY_DN8328_c0_g1_i1.p1  ORF type:complete len:278 (+),score=77.84 TRINITY_DN8328_c0_g1_i1:111-836(+)